MIEKYTKGNKLPPALSSLIYRYYTAAIFSVIMAIAISVLFKSISAAGFPLLLGILLAGFGFFKQQSIIKNGYIEKMGRCLVHHQIIKIGKGVDGFKIVTPTEVIYVPCDKRKSPPPVGCLLKVYISATTSSYESDGVIYYGNYYGYEIMPESI